MSSSVDWRRRLLSPPREGERTKAWHRHVSVLVAMVVFGLLMGLLRGEGVSWWLAVISPLGWTLPLFYIVVNVLSRRRE